MSSRTARALSTLPMLTGFAAGVWLTWTGLQGMADAQHTGVHLLPLGATFVALASPTLLARRWPQLAPLPITAALVSLLALATGTLPALLAVLATGLSWTCVGHLLLPQRWLCTHLEKLLAGAATVGTAIAVNVHLPIWYRGTFALLAALPVALAWRHARDVVRDVWRWLRSGAARHGTGAALLDAGLGALAVLMFAIALMPECGHDALAFHMVVPEKLLWHHRWTFDVEHYVWAAMPMLGDWLNSITYGLAGETAARIGNVGFVLVLTRLVATAAGWAGSGALGSRMVALLFLASPLVLCESASLFVDSIWTSLLVAGALCVLRSVGVATGGCAAAKDLVLGGLLLGSALAAKAVTFMALPVLALPLLLRPRTWLTRPRLAATASGAFAFAIAGAVPYARALLVTGNPVFPFFNAVFRSKLYPAENFQPPAIFGRGMDWDVLYDITFDSGRFLEAWPGAGGFQWLLLVLPAALALPLLRQWRGLSLLLVAFGCAYLTFHQTAYLRYVLPSFALAPAACGTLLSQPVRTARVVAWSGAIAALSLNLRHLTSASHVAIVDARAIASDAGRDAWLATTMPHRLAVTAADALGPPGNPVAFFASAMPFGLRARALFPNWYNRSFQDAVTSTTDAASLGALLGDHHVRYLLMDDAWGAPELRTRARECTELRQAFGAIELRELRREFRFGQQLVRSPELDDRTAWYAPAHVTFEDGGAALDAGAILNQQVAVTPDRGYELRLVLAAQPATADGQLLLVWQDAHGNYTGRELLPITPDTPLDRTVDVTAPHDAHSAVLSATCASGAFIVRTISLRH